MNKEQTIAAILTASRKPLPEIAESRQFLCTDGEWRNCMGIPSGIETVKPYEVRTIGYAFRDKNGTTYGIRAKTPEELVARFEAQQDKNEAEFREILELCDEKQLSEKADYWLKKSAA